MTPFTLDQWFVVALVFLLGLVLGMFLLAGRKWKRRYQEEHARVLELERENQELRRERDEMTVLRERAARHPVGTPEMRDRI